MIFILLGVVSLIVGSVLSLAIRNNRVSAAASLASQALATVLISLRAWPVLLGSAPLQVRVEWSFPVETVYLRLDALSAFFLSFSLPLTFLGTLYAVGYLKPAFNAGRHGGSHFALLNLVSLSFVLIYTIENALVFLVGWELAALAAWLLVIWDYKNQKIRFAGFNYLVSTHIGLVFLVAAVMVMYSHSGGADFQRFGTFLGSPSVARDLAFVLLVLAFALKSAFFPFHTWLPRAHAAAPAHVSALMSGVIHKAGLFGLLRFTLLMGQPDPWMGWSLLGFSALSALMGVLYSATQRDLKRLLGYSSTENVGIAGMGFGLGYLGLTYHRPVLVALGFGGGLLHILNHALFKCLLFYAAGAVYRAAHTVDLERLGGLFKKMPLTGALFLLGGLAISGLPPLNGFVSEFLLYSGLVDASAPEAGRLALIGAAGLLAFVGAISALSITRAFGVGFLGTPRDPNVHCEGEVGVAMLAPMLLHGVGVISLGLVPGAAIALIAQPTALFTARVGDADLAGLSASLGRVTPLVTVSLILGAAIAVLALLRWTLAPRRVATSPTWGCGYPHPNARMQYTASSFSETLYLVVHAALASLRRSELPKGLFPKDGYLAVTTVDAVERRMFEVLGEGEDLVAGFSKNLPEEPRISFALGLVTLVLMVGLLLTSPGALP